MQKISLLSISTHHTRSCWCTWWWFFQCQPGCHYQDAVNIFFILHSLLTKTCPYMSENHWWKILNQIKNKNCLWRVFIRDLTAWHMSTKTTGVVGQGSKWYKLWLGFDPIISIPTSSHHIYSLSCPYTFTSNHNC